MLLSKDKPNKVRAKLIIDVESEFYDDESTAETLRYCVEQDLEDAGFNVINSEVFDLTNKISEQTKWIPVSERLPNQDEYIKNNGLFNVSDGNRSYSAWFDIYDKQMFGEHTISGFHVDHAIIAWMPLPERYKIESEVKE